MVDVLTRQEVPNKAGARLASAVFSPEVPERGIAHLYFVRLDPNENDLSELNRWLSSDEKARAERFRFDLHRDRFIAGRAQLRQLLGACLGQPPESLRFEYGPNGKPELLPGQVPLTFNLAHCDNVGLIGINQGAPIGVDIEKVRLLPEFDELVDRFFSPREAGAFRELDASKKPEAFFNLWTRKEAWLKATGEGIANSLNQVEVSFLPDEAPELRHLPAGNGNVKDWSIGAFSFAPGFVAAFATRAPHCQGKIFEPSARGFTFSEINQPTQTQLS
jgi:4'-phosphopantetheinyl transferase